MLSRIGELSSTARLRPERSTFIKRHEVFLGVEESWERLSGSFGLEYGPALVDEYDDDDESECLCLECKRDRLRFSPRPLRMSLCCLTLSGESADSELAISKDSDSSLLLTESGFSEL